ncbi:uncharacterized protein YcbK (DUF882 family) [Rhodoblastus acidophilus]|uniref:DUF882 domain-containing protein n=1 Tax=Rhodoblastus acidophilus TaxID=1074 RepID=UPI002224924B|nr:DUF882 domain-containing protein [Rhodoblastus acidophilus]MCW2315927.1 uncharacterized protein YcbK (DUF882 family) [Rhodoblastus acidophilus]
MSRISSLWRGRGKACATLLALFATLAPNALESAAANGDTRTIYLYHSHSKESIAATFRVNGHYDAETLEKLNWFLRDWRNDEPTHMDPRLFDVLWEAYRSTERMGPDDPIVVVSAYRCPATNAMLRRRSRAVAEHSQHMLGKAMDTTMPGLSMEKLREIGMRMQRGGVGYYPRANTPFVHLDVGGVRHWPRMTYDQLARLFPDGKTVHIASNGKLLPGYEEARAEILARGGEAISVAEAEKSGGGLRGFFASLFGGGGEDEDEARESVPAKPTRVASRAPAPQAAEEDEGVSQVDPQRRLMAKAETDLPRGETYMSASAAPAAAAVQPEARTVAPAPARLESAKPEPIEDQTAEPAPEKPHPLDAAPQPPRRPAALEPVVADAPQPPPRPIGLTALPPVIAQGGKDAKTAARPPEPNPALAYATPLPPPRPSAPALRPAAKAEQSRIERASVQPAPPARVSPFAAAPAPASTPQHARAAAAAPALRAAARGDVLAGAPAAGAAARFGANDNVLGTQGFSKAKP